LGLPQWSQRLLKNCGCTSILIIVSDPSGRSETQFPVQSSSYQIVFPNLQQDFSNSIRPQALTQSLKQTCSYSHSSVFRSHCQRDNMALFSPCRSSYIPHHMIIGDSCKKQFWIPRRQQHKVIRGVWILKGRPLDCHYLRKETTFERQYDVSFSNLQICQPNLAEIISLASLNLEPINLIPRE